jgi:GAF domain-containing protein
MIGWSVANAQPRIAQVAAEDAVRLATAELPNTRSEAALPLRARGKVIGALTVQSDRPGAFDEAALAVLQIMADQVAVALENARLFVESQAALETTRRAYGELSRQGWIELLRTRQELGYRYAQASTAPAEGEWQPEMIQAVASSQSVVGNVAGNPTLAVPLKVRDQVIGVLDLRRDTPGRLWTDEERLMAEAMVEQLNIALESARLYQDTQRRATQERLVGQVVARMSETLDMETVLRTAIREMGEAMGMAEVEVRLGTPTDGTMRTTPA